MVNIEEIKSQIVERLLPLNPDKIILFGSYAYGTPTEESDIDLFLLKDDLPLDKIREYRKSARKKLRDIYTKFKINGIDILAGPTKMVEEREDYFYKEELLKLGKVWYERS